MSVIGGPLTMTFIALETTATSGNHGGADRSDHFDAGHARILWLFLHHLALPSAR